MPNTLLLVFIHGFKGTDHTFNTFPNDLRALIAHTIPKINVLSVTYPQFETRGELKDCVAKFREWLQNKVIDLEVANGTPSPTVDPSVHVVLCGHSMGGVVAAETLLSVVKDEAIPLASSNNVINSTMTYGSAPKQRGNATTSESQDQLKSALPQEPTRLFFPYIRAVLAFDTPYLGISPGVLAHGAEQQFNQASSAYKAFGTATELFGWNSPRTSSPQPAVDAATRGLPPTDGSTGGGWAKWGRYAAFGGAAAAIAGAAGAAYLNKDQITQGFAWAGSHLEFVGCLARGAELQKRVENIVELTRTNDIGFANFYAALGEKTTSQTKYAGSVLGSDRTFCVVPKETSSSPTGTKRDVSSSDPPPPKRWKEEGPGLSDETQQGEKVQEFARDTSKSKGRWVKCVNEAASDEISAHMSIFLPRSNPNYHVMLPAARDQVVAWVDRAWYESSVQPGAAGRGEDEAATVGAEAVHEADA